MKAYQLKIMIKDSHPPIWRRIVVPAGLTFSQLTIVINEVMDWCGAHMSEYIFDKLDVELMDDFEPEDVSDWNAYEVLDAKDYKIDEFFDKTDKCVYVYDFGDYWEHIVTIEKKLDDYEYNYPMVIKYKGETPYEDCGGIDGWYYLLNILDNPKSPEYEEMKEWADEEYREPFDMSFVNEGLMQLELTKEKSEPKTRTELYDDFFAGKPFYTIVTPKHRKQSATNSAKYNEEELRGKIIDLMQKREELEENAILDAYRSSDRSFDEVIDFLTKRKKQD